MRAESELRAYQQRIATHLYQNDEAFCVARPGGGKTVSALTAITELLRDGVIRHALIVAPKRVARAVWPDEIVGWEHIANLRYRVLTGSPEDRKTMLGQAADYDLTIVGIDVICSVLHELSTQPADSPLFDLLVIDEVSKLRNPTGVRAKELAKHARRWKMVWGLTGTLRPSGPENLFMPARVVTRGKLWGKSYYNWRKERFYPADQWGYTWSPLPGAEDKINEEIAPYIVTLAEGEMPQIPALTIIQDRFDLPADARQVYDDMAERLFVEVKGKGVEAASAAVATGKLAQIANGFLYDPEAQLHVVRIHQEKKLWLEDLVDESTGPVLLVYEFLEDLDIMKQVVGQDLPYLRAGVSDKQSDRNIKAWNAGELPFMALHPASGGHGLNLQHGGCDIAWYSPTWSPEMWEQTIARLHRSGQTKPVICRVCFANGTVDGLKWNRVHLKMTAQEAFEAYLREHQARRAKAA